MHGALGLVAQCTLVIQVLRALRHALGSTDGKGLLACCPVVSVSVLVEYTTPPPGVCVWGGFGSDR